MFKFYNIPDIKTIKNIIGKKPTIKLSSAFDLNDPFELKFNLKINPYSEEQQSEYFKTYPTNKIEDFNEWQQKIISNKKSLWYIEQEQRNTLAQELTLCSFSENNKNNLMWSHYTNNHKGICVEYSEDLSTFLKKTNGFFGYSKVNYSEIPPIVDSLEEISSKILKMIFNKQIEWKYEKEFRVVFRSRNDIDYIPIERELIKAIYIGSRCNLNYVKKIIEITSSSNIEIYYGITIGDTYDVQFVKHENGVMHMRTFW